MPQKVTLEKGTKKGNRSFKITAVERKRLGGRDKVFLLNIKTKVMKINKCVPITSISI